MPGSIRAHGLFGVSYLRDYVFQLEDRSRFIEQYDREPSMRAGVMGLIVTQTSPRS
jgi:hypothetical protein